MSNSPVPPTWLDGFFLSGYNTIKNVATVFPKEFILNFEGPGVSISDDAVNGQTIATIIGGSGSTTTTTANITQPAALANVTVPVVSTASLAAGLVVFIAGGGYYDVVSVTDATHFVAQNLGLSGNAAPTTVINTGALVVPAGPSSTLIIEGNDITVTPRQILDFRGFLVTDDSVGGRTIVQPGSGAPVVVSGSHTMQPGEVWAEVHPDDVVTMPVVPVPGLELAFTGVGTTFSGGHPVTFGGNGPNLEDPQDRNNVSGTRPPAASVKGLTENTTWRFRYNGTLYRYVS